MTEFLNDILQDRQNILTDMGQHGRQLEEFCQRVRETPLEELDDADKIQLVFLLLKQLQPYLSAANLSTQHLTAQGPVALRAQPTVPVRTNFESFANVDRNISDRSQNTQTKIVQPMTQMTNKMGATVPTNEDAILSEILQNIIVQHPDGDQPKTV